MGLSEGQSPPTHETSTRLHSLLRSSILRFLVYFQHPLVHLQIPSFHLQILTHSVDLFVVPRGLREARGECRALKLCQEALEHRSCSGHRLASKVVSLSWKMGHVFLAQQKEGPTNLVCGNTWQGLRSPDMFGAPMFNACNLCVCVCVRVCQLVASVTSFVCQS